MITVVEHRISSVTAPDAIYRVYADVANWRRWDPDMKRATLDGPSPSVRVAR